MFFHYIILIHYDFICAAILSSHSAAPYLCNVCPNIACTLNLLHAFAFALLFSDSITISLHISVNQFLVEMIYYCLPKLVGNEKSLLNLSFIQVIVEGTPSYFLHVKDMQPSMALLFTTETSSSHYGSLAGFLGE